jgi:RsiW-degrading membrane proteinase PrsW (M82 family)
MVWEIRDLGSTNGTYLNHQLLQHPVILKHGDRIRLGTNGPELVFECSHIAPIAKEVIDEDEDSVLSHTELVPVLSTYRDLFKKAYLLPGMITIVFVILLFFAGEEAVCPAIWINPFRFQTSCYNILLGSYLSLTGFYVVYLLCGKLKPWWVLVASGVITVTILITPLAEPFFWLFRQVLPGDLTALRGQSVNPFTWFIAMFFGAGLMEELLKAVPIFIALYLGRQMRSPWREKIGVWEPLDGILLGAASAVGFTLIETLGQYVPSVTASAGATFGLMLLVPRILGSIAGHLAYSGYFGYFIGLSVLKPRKRWKILGIGYLASAVIHTLWNSVGVFAQTDTAAAFLLCLVGVMSYALLMTAILKARKLSPNRVHNFATQVHPRGLVK